MKQKLGEEYLNCTKSILKTKLNGKNMIKAINTYTTPVLTLSFGIVKWTPTDLDNLKRERYSQDTDFITPCRKGKTYSTTANGWQRFDRYNQAA
jgi:hypothetical protein